MATPSIKAKALENGVNLSVAAPPAPDATQAGNGVYDAAQNGAHNGSGGRYRRLPTGAHGLPREEVERDQRERLQGAMVELIPQRGYQALRILDLTKLAHVSRPTFYSLYNDKEDLLISAYEDIAGRTARTAMEAYQADGSRYERLQAAMRAFAELAAAEPEAMSLFLFGAFGAGGKTLERRNRALEAFENSIEASRDDAPATSATNLTIKVILGGIREVVATRLREQRASELPGLADELTAWAASYVPKLPQGLASPPAERAAISGETPELGSERARRAEGRLPSGRHDLPREYVVKNQRERIVDATAAIVAEKGLAALTIPEIASRASVSHETFYEMYPTKQDAFLGTQKIGLHQAFQIAVGAYEQNKQGDWPRGISEGLRALIVYLQAEPAHAHLSIVDTFAVSPDTLAIRDEVLRGFSFYFRPPERPPAPDGIEVPEVAAEAVVGGVWQVLHHYVAHGAFAELVKATPQLNYLLLSPFIGPKKAAKAARRAPVGDPGAPGGEE
jgi:AcrR family transcriptional regulator